MTRFRECEVHGHQVFWRGWFHKITDDGRIWVEGHDGTLVALNNLYHIKFTDRQPPSKEIVK